MWPVPPRKAVLFLLLNFSIKGPHLKGNKICFAFDQHKYFLVKKNTIKWNKWSLKYIHLSQVLFSFGYLFLLPLLLVLVLVFVCAAIFVLQLVPLLVSMFFVRRVPVKFYNTHVNWNAGKVKFIFLKGRGRGEKNAKKRKLKRLIALRANQTPTCINVHPHKQKGLPIAVLWFLPLLIFLVVLVFVLLLLVFVFMLVWVWKRERRTLDSTVKTDGRVIMCWEVGICYSTGAKSEMIKAELTLKRQIMYTPTSESRETQQPTSQRRSTKIHPRRSLTQNRNHISKSQVPSMQRGANVMWHLDWMYTQSHSTSCCP